MHRLESSTKEQSQSSINSASQSNHDFRNIGFVALVALSAVLVFYCCQPQKRVVGVLWLLGLRATVSWMKSDSSSKHAKSEQPVLVRQASSSRAVHNNDYSQRMAGVFAQAVRQGLRTAFR